MVAAIRRRGRPKGNEFDQLKRAFLRHAFDHFLDSGFEATKVIDITRSFGMSKQTVYVHFGDKLGLFKAALQCAIDDWLTPLEKLERLEKEDLGETLIGISRVVVEALMSPAGLRLIRIVNAEAFRLPEIVEQAYRRGHGQIAVHLADLFRRRLAVRAELGMDFDELSMVFLNLMSGPARRNAWGLEEDNIDVENFICQRVQLFLYGILPVAERTDWEA